MPLRLKLGLAFGTILLLTSIVALTGIYGMNRSLRAQRELYTVTNRLEAKFQTIVREQQAYVGTGRISHSRSVRSLIAEIRQDILSVLALIRDRRQKNRVENVLASLEQYDASFSDVIQTLVDMETMKSRLLHESQRLITNAGAIEQLGGDALKILSLMNDTMMAQISYMVDETHPTARKVIDNALRIISLAQGIKASRADGPTRLYAFRIANIAKAYQDVFQKFVTLSRAREQSVFSMDQAFERFKIELDGYIRLVTEKENRFILLLQRWVIAISLVVIVLGIMATLVLSKRIITPIKLLQASAQRILDGDMAARVDIPATDEVGELGRIFNQMTRKLAHSFESLSEYRNHLEDLVKERTRKIRAEIQDHKATRDALEKERNRALQYFDIAGSMMVVLDADETVAHINRAGLRILKGSAKEIVGKNWFDTFVPEQDREISRMGFQRLIAEEREPVDAFENRILTLEGDQRTVAWHNSVIRDHGGRIRATLSSGEDITEFKRMEAERVQLQEKLQQARKMEAIGTLAGGIAHDFNNILFPIIGYTEMAIAELPDDTPNRKRLENVLKGAMRARDLVQQILAFSRQKQMAKRPINVAPVIKEALKLLRSTIPKNIEIRQEIPRNLPAVLGDPTEIYEIVMNLCTNAFHAMEETGGCLSVTLCPTRITGRDKESPDLKPGPYCLLTITDTGTGIPATIMGQIFDPYFTTKKFGKGSGLGLSVTHGIVRDYGGEIRVSSQPGRGTEFSIYLPATHRDTLPSDPPLESGGKNAGTEQILLVDDEDAIVDMGSISLGMMGYRVEGFTNGHDALQAFAKAPDSFDVVVTDMAMPGMVGTTLSKKIKEIRPDIPVIICTGFSEQINAENAKAFGIDAFLKKPMLIDALSAKIRKILDKRVKSA